MALAPEPSGAPDDQQHAPLVSAGNSDRCPVCGAHLAVDQRYCVECGTRRGAARFQLAGPATAQSAATGAAAPSAGASGSSRFRRLSSNTALLVGLLIILVALGVGVLIGHNGNAPKTAGQPKVTVNLNGGSSAGTSDSAATSGSSATGSNSGSASSGATSSGSSSNSGSKTKSSSTPKASKKTTAAAAATNPNASASGKAGTAAAAQSFSKSATKKSTLGGGCTAGTAGCKGGKQTGNLF